MPLWKVRVEAHFEILNSALSVGYTCGILCHHHTGGVQKRQEQRAVPVVQEGEEVKGTHAVKTCRRQ